MPDYAKDVLVDADWAQQHIEDPNIRFVEVDVDTAAYDEGHIPGAVGWNWKSQLSDGLRRDIVSREELETLLRASGIGAGDDDRRLRRQQQLVRRLGVLAAEALRPRRRQGHERRAQALGRRGPAAVDRRPEHPGHGHTSVSDARLQPPGLPRRRAARRSTAGGAARRRPLAGGVLRRAARAREAARRRARSAAATSRARRTSPGRPPSATTARSRTPTSSGASTAPRASRRIAT